MKPHLPLTLLVALLGSFVSQAVEIPDNYEQIDLWTPSYLNDYISNTEEDNYAFILWTDVDFTSTTNPTWTSSTPLVTGGNLIFTTAEGYDPVALSFGGGQSTVFEQPASLTFDTLSTLTISNQTGSKVGGSIDLGTTGSLSIRNVNDGIDNPDKADVEFSGNKITITYGGAYGGAIYANGANTSIDISDNGIVSFEQNMVRNTSFQLSTCGGAIYSTGTVNINNNADVTFSGNYAFTSTSTGSLGGAIYSVGTVNINNNTGGVAFSENYASSSNSFSRGGAIYSKGGVNINNNADVTFSGNYVYTSSPTSSFGGAIYSEGTVNINNNTGGVAFSENYASSYNSPSRGGAIHSNGVVNINNNTGGVAFSENYVSNPFDTYSESYGGAIYSTGSISLAGNDSVTFEKNYEQKGSTYRLRSIHMAPDSSGDNLVLAAKTGGHITFYDSIYMDNYSGSTVSFNADYQDADGVTQKAGGDIIFSGKYVKEHLDSIFAADTAEGKTPRTATSTEITNSQTSAIYNHITLYGGSLQVVDGAKLNGQGLTVAADSGAKLLLRDGSMNHSSSYQFTFNNDTTLELQGLNTIRAYKITLASGSALTVTVGEDNLNTAALTLGGTDLATSKLTVNLKREDGLTSGKYKIIRQSSASDFTTKSAWTAENVTVNGSGYANRAIFSDLVWENGTLYYNVGRTIWGNASGDRLWNTSSDNWTMNDRSYTYLDGMDVSFTDLGAGEVKLVGDIAPASIEVNNSEGNDYIFAAAAGGGKLVGTTGITKNGTGALTLTTANTHTGAMVLNGGTLNVHHSTALGATASAETATVTTAVGTTLAVGNKSHVVLAAENDIKGAVSVAEGATLELRNKGYTAESSNIAGTLHFKGAAAATSKVGILSGTGSVKVEDSSVTVAEIKDYTGKLSVQGNNAALNITKGNYSGAGSIGVMGANAALNMSSSNITLRSGGVLSLTGSITDSIAQAALLDANNVTISNGAELAVKAITANSPVQNLSAAFTIDTTPSTGYDANRAYNVLAGGKIDAALLTLAAGATYTANAANVSLSDGELTLAITSTATKRIELNLTLSADYDPAAQVVLFSDVATVNFIRDGITAKFTDGAVYTLSAADYFNSVWINNMTTLVYDSNQKVVYLEGVSNVPEPTTSTLGLLALAALAARRRRK